MDYLLLFIKLLSLKKTRFQKKMHFWDEILWGRFWSCLKHSQHVIYPDLKILTLRARIFGQWQITTCDLSLAKNSRKYVCITPPSRLKNEEGERNSSYTRGCMWRVYRWKSYNFHFHEKAMSHDLLVQMAYSYGVTIQMRPLPSAILSHGAIY